MSKIPVVMVEDRMRELLDSATPEPKKVKLIEVLFKRNLDKEEATELLEVLGETFQNYPLSQKFHYRLTRGSRKYLLDVLRSIANRQPPPKYPWDNLGPDGKPPMPAQPLFRLEREVGHDYNIKRQDLEIEDFGYIDNFIDHVTSDYDHQVNDRVVMVVHYKNGKTLAFLLNDIPVTWRFVNAPKGTHIVRINMRIPMADHYVERGGFTYPVDKDGHVILSSNDTPNLVKFRSAVLAEMIKRRQVLEIAETVNAFAQILKLYVTYQNGVVKSWWSRKSVPYQSRSNYRPVSGTVPSERGSAPVARGGSPPPGGNGTPPPAGGNNGSGGGGNQPPNGNPPPNGGRPQLTVIQGGGMRPSGVPTTQQSLAAAGTLVKDTKGINFGRPVFRTVPDIDRYFKSLGFRLAANDEYGPKGPDNRQLIYYRAKDNVIVKIKTAGYAGGRRGGRPTMSVEVGDGKGVEWRNAVFKVDGKGGFVAKNQQGAQVEIAELPPNHPARAQGMQYGFPKPNQDPMKMQPVTKMEMFQGGQGPRPDLDAWADRSHFDLPPGFNPAGAGGLVPGQ